MIDCGTIEYLLAIVRKLNHLNILKVVNFPLHIFPFSMVENVGGKDVLADQNGQMFLVKQLDLQST